MQKLLLSLLFLTASLPVHATQNVYSNTALAATAASANTAFVNNAGIGRDGAAFTAIRVYVCNEGANEVFITFFNATATVADFKIDAGTATAPNCVTFVSDTRTGPASGGWSSISTICSAAETATLRVWAER